MAPPGDGLGTAQSRPASDTLSYAAYRRSITNRLAYIETIPGGEGQLGAKPHHFQEGGEGERGRSIKPSVSLPVSA